ncbi:macrolide export ATP-binding/permease protein MacB [archaeon BMS3Abin17]|nr:macrolide export ATP-binding/permease protein MacB [archaeon BMS3Abin17]HDZ60116.1 ABC transporter permease [Candidatus Pacearchaeota archaeon]
MLKDYFSLALKNLRKRKLRTWLTMIGIFISIATIFILISLSLGLQNAVEEQFNLLGADKFFVQPATGFLGPPGSIESVILTEDDIDTILKVRGVKDISYFVAGNAKVEFAGTTRYHLVWGAPPESLGVYTESGIAVEDGRLFEKGDSYSVILGNLHKTGNLFGRPVNVGDKITLNDKKVRVRGILELVGNPDDDRMILMDIDSFRELFGIPERVDWIMVQVEDGEDVVEVSKRTEEKLRKARGETEDNQEFDVMTPEELLESFGNILNIITVFLAGIAAISLLVGAIGIANTMYTSILERTKEIGVMKAIGARNSDILKIFLIESGMLGLVGGIAGVLLGMGIGKTIEYIAINNLGTNLLQVSFPLWLVGGCLGFAFIIGAVSGVLPAMQASKTNVADALRYE